MILTIFWDAFLINDNLTRRIIYRWGSNGHMFVTEKTILFQGSRGPEGVQHFPVGSSFFQGGGGRAQILISIEPNITCDFLRRGEVYGSGLKHKGSNTDRNSILNMWTD